MTRSRNPSHSQVKEHENQPRPSYDNTNTFPLSAFADIASQQEYLPVPEPPHRDLLLLAEAAVKVLASQTREEKIENCIVVRPLPDDD
jgi:hypothetical protein